MLSALALTLHPLAAQQPSAADAIAAGDWTAARAAALAELKSNPRDSIAWTYLGIAADHTGDHAEALRAFAKAAAASPRSTLTHNNYGAALETAGQTTEASAEYRRSLALDPNQPAPLVNLSRLLLHRNTPADRTEASTLLARAFTLAPDEEIARNLLLLAPCAQPSTRSADHAAANTAATSNSTLQPYAEFEANHAETVPAQTAPMVGRALLTCGFKQQATQVFGTALQSDGRNPQLITGLAGLQLTAGDARAAGRTLESAVANGVEYPAVYSALAHVYQQTGHPDNAIAAMQRAIALPAASETEAAELQFRYGMLLLDTHAPKAAELRLQQATTEYPQASRLWFALGLALFDQTDPVRAQAAFDRSIALDPNFAPALAYRGLTALDQQRYPEAEQWYRRAIAIDPAAADFFILLSEALEREHPGEPAPAREALRHSIALDPNSAVAYLRLGRIDLDAGNAADAVTHLSHALSLDPAQISAHFYLARAYRRLQQPDRAAAESTIFESSKSSETAADRLATQTLIQQVGHMAF